MSRWAEGLLGRWEARGSRLALVRCRECQDSVWACRGWACQVWACQVWGCQGWVCLEYLSQLHPLYLPQTHELRTKLSCSNSVKWALQTITRTCRRYRRLAATWRPLWSECSTPDRLTLPGSSHTYIVKMDATPFNRVTSLPLNLPPLEEVRGELRSAASFLAVNRLHNSAKW